MPTGFQRGPFFEIQTDRFALIAVDTGIVQADRSGAMGVARVGARCARAASSHGGPRPPALRRRHVHGAATTPSSRGSSELLLEHGVHDRDGGRHARFRVLRRAAGATGDRAVHYFVNGGGGAYLSIGTALDWPAQPPTRRVGASIRARTRSSRRSTRRRRGGSGPRGGGRSGFRAWPFSTEWLSALFDYNVAPFFQSFVEVRVERSAKRVRLLPYGVARPAALARPRASAGPHRDHRRAGRFRGVDRADADDQSPTPDTRHPTPEHDARPPTPDYFPTAR